MNSRFLKSDKYLSPPASRRIQRFMACESGATTAEFVIIAAVVVSLAAGVVTTTRSGATVSASNTATALEAQAPVFQKLADGQQAVKSAYTPSSGSTGNSISTEPGQNVTVMPVQGGASSADDSATDAADATSDENSDTDADTDQQTADETTQTDTDQGSDQTADNENQNTDTETTQTDNSSNGGGTVLPDDDATDTENTEEQEETEVVQNVKPGCENPYNKRGKIKRKCR